MEQHSPTPIPPPAATVVGNRWVDIDVPEIGRWQPDRMVTVVVPYFEQQGELERTLAALTEQTYPSGLIEVIVADDGSVSAPVIPAFADVLDVSVRVQEDRGFGLARARNLGAHAATGEILIFIDCDMIAERQHVEAHARWHHTVSNAVVFGFRWHADFSSCSPSDVANAVALGDVHRLLVDQTPQRPEWIEDRLDRTDSLTGPFDDFFRVTSGGNLSIRRDLYLDVGGNDESFDQWGGEDNEFGFRVMQAGAVVVPERQGVCWHQGEGHKASPEELRSQRIQLPKLQNLIAELGYRKPQPGCSYTVPYSVVAVDGRDTPAEVTGRTVESVLGSRFHDLVVVVAAPLDADESKWLIRRFASDTRVHVVPNETELEHEYRFSPLRVELPSGTLFHEMTLGHIVDRVKASGVGILHVTLSETDATGAMFSATSTRAMNRARHITTIREDIEPLAGELFGEHRISGRELGLGMIHESGEVTEPVDPRGDQAPAARIARYSNRIATLESRHAVLENRNSILTDLNTTLKSRSAALEDRNAALGSRRSLRLADSAGDLRSARTKQQVGSALSDLWKAIRGIDPQP